MSRRTPWATARHAWSASTDRQRAKLAVAVAMLLALVVLVTAVVAGGARLLVGREGSQGDAATVLQTVDLVPEDAPDLVEWTRDAWRRERVMEPDTRVAVAAAYLRAWSAMARWQANGDAAAVEDTFSGQLVDTVTAAPADGSATLRDLHHRLTLDFYALDGATVAVRDRAALTVRGDEAGGGYLVGTERYAAVLVLEDGYWRVAQLRRERDEREAVVLDGTVSGVSPVPPAAGALPRTTRYDVLAWEDPQVVREDAEADLARVRDLGLDGVSVPLPQDVFTGSATVPEAEESLRALLDVARRLGLTVDLVALDGLTDLGPSSWSPARATLSRLLDVVDDHPAVGLWTVATAPADASGTPSHRAVLATVLTRLAHERTDVPVTIAWGTAAEASDEGLAGLVDVVTWAPSPAELADGSLDLPSADRPVRVSAPGITAAGGSRLLPRGEDDQAWEAATVVASGAEGSGGFALGTLYDGAAATGLLRVDGSERPAAEQLDDPTAGPPGSAWLRSPLLKLLVVVVLGLVLLGAWRRLRARLAPRLAPRVGASWRRLAGGVRRRLRR